MNELTFLNAYFVMSTLGIFTCALFRPQHTPVWRRLMFAFSIGRNRFREVTWLVGGMVEIQTQNS